MQSGKKERKRENTEKGKSARKKRKNRKERQKYKSVAPISFTAVCKFNYQVNSYSMVTT